MKPLINLERLKAKLSNDFGITLKAVDTYLQKAVFNREVKSLNSREIKQLTVNADKELQSLFGAYIDGLKGNWRTLFSHRYQSQSDEAYKTVRKRINTPKSLLAYADKAFDKPLNLTTNVGVSLDELTKAFTPTESQRLIRAIRLAHSESLDNAKLIQMIRGSRANRYQDGILATTSRNAQTIARTGTAIMASEAKQAFINDNLDIIKGIQVNATLDRRTCLVAGTLINTPTGRRPIEQIQKGELVFGGSGKVREVTATLKSYNNRLCKVTLSNGEIIVCTQDHRWWNGNEWIEAKDLKIGDFLPKTL